MVRHAGSQANVLSAGNNNNNDDDDDNNNNNNNLHFVFTLSLSFDVEHYVGKFIHESAVSCPVVIHEGPTFTPWDERSRNKHADYMATFKY